METKDFLEGVIDRSFADDPVKLKAVEESRTVRFTISTDAKDRHGTVLNMKGWMLDAFNRNPIVGYQHNVYGDNMCVPPNPDDTLGAGRAWMETQNGRDVLMGEVKFEPADINPLAEKVFRKVLLGTLRATSVGFLEVGQGRTEEKKDAKGNVTSKTYFFEGQELLEFSIVNIPSNPEATRKVVVNHARAGVTMLNRIGLPVKEIRKIVNGILDSIDDDAPKRKMKVGDKVMPKKGKAHMPMHEGMVMTVTEISTEAMATRMEDGMVHKWYVEDELEPAMDMEKSQGKTGPDPIHNKMLERLTKQ